MRCSSAPSDCSEAPVNIYTMAGMIWALSSHYFPLAYLALGPALRALDVRMEEAGLVSGARYWQVLPEITLPLLRPAILSTMLLLFMLGMSSYEVPRLIGRPARIDVFTTDIQGAIIQTPPEFGVASALALTLLVICIVAVFFYRRATRHAEAFATITGKGYMPTRIELGRWRWPVAIAIGADVRDRARAAAVHAGLAVVLPQPVAAVHGLGRAAHLGELPVHPAATRSSSRR